MDRVQGMRNLEVHDDQTKLVADAQISNSERSFVNSTCQNLLNFFRGETSCDRVSTPRLLAGLPLNRKRMAVIVGWDDSAHNPDDIAME